MKYISTLILSLLLLFTACADKGDNNKPTNSPSSSQAQRDQPNLEQVSSDTKSETPPAAANPDRKPSTPEQLETAKKIIAAASDADVAGVNAKQLFKNYCAICHGTTGDLNVNGATDLTASTLGLEERVAQVYHGRGLMTPFKGLLKDHEIVAVVKYIEELRK